MIKWFTGHERVMSLLLDIKGGKPLVLLFPCAARWLTHLTSFQRLQLFAPAIQSLATNHCNEVLQDIKKAKESQEKAKAILRLSKDPVLWMKLAVYKRVLNPLSVAQLIAQANTTRLDHILLTTGKLYTQYQAFTLRLVESLSVNVALFSWQHNGLYHLLVRLFERFYGPVPPEMWIDWVEYKSCSGAFSDISLGIQQWV